jgi:ketol-acid reductoisomerase
VARAYACAIGAIPHAIFDTTFQEECESDLFGEQAVLCGGLVELIRSAYVTLVEAGFDPQMAYFECVHEAKLITDLLFERGIAGMRAGTSRAAQFGGLTRGPRVIGPEARDAMKQILAEIQSGQFAAEYQADTQAGSPKLKQLAAAEAAHPIEKVSRQLREVIHTSRKNSQDG